MIIRFINKTFHRTTKTRVPPTSGIKKCNKKRKWGNPVNITVWSRPEYVYSDWYQKIVFTSTWLIHIQGNNQFIHFIFLFSLFVSFFYGIVTIYNSFSILVMFFVFSFFGKLSSKPLYFLLDYDNLLCLYPFVVTSLYFNGSNVLSISYLTVVAF